MPRRLPYVVTAALLVLMVSVIVWRVFRVHPPRSATLAEDAVLLTSRQGKWQSKVMKITVRDGTVHDEMLGIEFQPSAPAGQSNAPDAQARLFTSSPSKGIPHLMEASASFGDASFRDVRLQESNGIRTITFRRALPANDPNPAKTQRRFDRYWSVSFRYELKDNVLTLKGFSTTNKVTWGVSEFIVPKDEITFKALR